MILFGIEGLLGDSRRQRRRPRNIRWDRYRKHLREELEKIGNEVQVGQKVLDLQNGMEVEAKRAIVEAGAVEGGSGYGGRRSWKIRRRDATA